MELNPYTVVFQVINFLVLAAILGRFLFKPVVAILNQRQAQVQSDLDQAAQSRQQAEEFYHQGKQSIVEANLRADHLLKEAAQSADELRAEVIAEAEERARRLIVEAEARLRREQEKARDALRKEVAHLAITVAGKVLPKALDTDQQKRLLDEAIREVGSDDS